MARVYHSAFDATEKSTQATSITHTTLTFTPDANSTYAIFINAKGRNNSASGRVEIELVNSAIDGAGSFVGNPRADVGADDIQDRMSFGGFRLDTFGASPAAQDYEVRFRRPDSGTAFVKDVSIVALKLEPDDEFFSDQGYPLETGGTNSDWLDVATLTFTPATAGDYLVLMSMTYGNGTSSTTYYSGSFEWEEGAYFSEQQTRENDESGADYMFFDLAKLALPASLATLQLRRGANNNNSFSSGCHAMLALRLDGFSENFYAGDFTARTANNATYVTQATLTETPTASEDLLWLGNLYFRNSSTSTHGGGRYRQDLVQEDDPFRQESEGSADRFPGALAKLIVGGVAGETTWDNQFNNPQGGTTTCEWGGIAILNVEGSTGPSGIVVTPAPASAIAAVVDPAVELGSLTLAPTPAAAIGAVVDPTLELGSLILAPTPASAIAAVVDPTVEITAPSLIVTPQPAGAIAATVAPGVVLGDLVLAPPPADAIGAVVDPTLELGDLVVTPSPAAAVAVTIAPVVALGDLVLVPGVASAIAAVVDPTIVIAGGGVGVVPGPAGARAEALAPTVELGDLVLAPGVVTAGAEAIDPAVEIGPLDLTPAPASAIGAVVDPTLELGSLDVTPAPAAAIAGTQAPTIVQSSVAVTPAFVIAIADTADPTIEVGAVIVTPAPASAIADLAIGEILEGDLVVDGGIAFAVGATFGPTIEGGSLLLARGYALGVQDLVEAGSGVQDLVEAGSGVQDLVDQGLGVQDLKGDVLGTQDLVDTKKGEVEG